MVKARGGRTPLEESCVLLFRTDLLRSVLCLRLVSVAVVDELVEEGRLWLP